MNFRKPLIAGLAVLLVLTMSGNSLADISNAAVLFLRIAPGSRAAGMGEAYVAVADDATATHWNPAGLGNHPLSDTWIEAKVPQRYVPLSGFAPLSTGNDRSYLDYDVWAITPEGLIRYDNKRWNTEEVFGTRTDETVEMKVRNYFRTNDDSLMARMVERVAALNNAGAYDDLVALQERVLEAVPADYDRFETIKMDLDSLLVCFELCRVNWDRVKEARERLDDGLKDEKHDNNEIDRVAVALERSRNRFLPEELRIPYSALFSGELKAIASTGGMLLVGSTERLARYNGKIWDIAYWEDGAAVNNVTTLYTVGDAILVGTSDGLGVFRGLTVSRLTTSEGALSGEIEAIGGSALTDLYAVADGRMYRYTGRQWVATQPYQVEVGDSMEKIAAKFSLFGSAVEKQTFNDLFRQGYEGMTSAASMDIRPEVSEMSTTTEAEAVVNTVDEAAVAEAEMAAEDATEPVAADPATAAEGIPGVDRPLVPGETIEVPLLASLKGRATAIHVGNDGWVWLGTDRGVFYYDGHQWVSYGYKEHVVADGETLEVLALQRAVHDDDAGDDYLNLLREINDLGDAEPEVGSTVLLYANPAGQPVNSINASGRKVYIATKSGLLEFDGKNWSRTSLHGMTRADIVGVRSVGSEDWIASGERMVVKGRGRSEISLMHVNWLPELADDLYYEFLSFVSPKEGLGTFGGSVTFISYGKFLETDEVGNIVGEFDSFDYAVALSYGVSLSNRLKGGVTAKFIYSRLAPQGQAKEQGTGTATGFAIDLGMLYHLNSRLTFGAALTNLGPKLTYIDAAQSDDLPRNMALGFAYKLLRSDYIKMLVTIEANKLLVGLDDKLSEEARQTVINGGAEFKYADLFSARLGYIYDQEGEIKTPTVGFGLSPFAWGEFDFAYIPSQDDFSLANTLRISLRIIL
jgi:hypothetical protein